MNSSRDVHLADPRLADSDDLSPARRFFRFGWVATEQKINGVPSVRADYVARVGNGVLLIDVREAAELAGPLGHLAGCSWMPLERVDELAQILSPDTPVVFVSGRGERSGEAATRLLRHPFEYVASLEGGIAEWRHLGFETVRSPVRPLPSGSRFRPHGPPKHGGKLTENDVRQHLGDPTEMHWTKAASLFLTSRLSCVDGRDPMAIVGTPGGDAGELLLMLGAYENIKGRPLEPREVSRMMLQRFDQLGRFYLHSDMQASSTLTTAMQNDPRLEAALANVQDPVQWQSFLQAPPVGVREAVLEHLLVDGHLGCGHLRLTSQRAADYGLRPGLTHQVVGEFFRNLWAGSSEPEFHVLPGEHDEAAVLRVHLAGGLGAFGAVPMIPPLSVGMQAFIVHADVAHYVRQRFVQSLQHSQLISASEEPLLLAEMSRLAEIGANQTLAELAAGLPIYDVYFTRKDHFEVQNAGYVGGKPA